MGFVKDLLKISKENGVKIMNTKDIAKYLGKNVSNIQRLVNYHKIIILKKGLYLLDNDINDYEIAFELDKNSYISLDTALYYYGLIPEIVLPLYSVTTKEPREFSNNKGNFIYKHIKDSIFFGYEFRDDFTFRIAQKEKALLDYFYFSKLRITQNIINSIDNQNYNTSSIKNIIDWFKEERFQNLDKIDFKKLIKYSKKMNKKVLFLAKLLEYYFNSGEYEKYL